MSSEIKKHLLDWLRDAHAMENQKESLLKGQHDRLTSYPELRAAIQKYVEVTRTHQLNIHKALERLGGDTSLIKDLGGKLMATGQNLVGAFMSDEVVKSLMTIYIFNDVAISSYKVLVAATSFFSDEEIKRICKNNLDEELAMSEWLDKKISESTQDFLARSVSKAYTG